MTSMTHTEPSWGPPTFLVKQTTDVLIAYATAAALPMTLSSLQHFHTHRLPLCFPSQHPAPATPCHRMAFKLLEPTLRAWKGRRAWEFTPLPYPKRGP